MCNGCFTHSLIRAPSVGIQPPSIAPPMTPEMAEGLCRELQLRRTEYRDRLEVEQQLTTRLQAQLEEERRNRRNVETLLQSERRANLLMQEELAQARRDFSRALAEAARLTVDVAELTVNNQRLVSENELVNDLLRVRISPSAPGRVDGSDL
jgi:hypothetical protein